MRVGTFGRRPTVARSDVFFIVVIFNLPITDRTKYRYGIVQVIKTKYQSYRLRPAYYFDIRTN